MWETSNTPEAFLTAKCSSVVVVYQRGMSYPANSTIFAWAT
jgi:hypothetical protein